MMSKDDARAVRDRLARFRGRGGWFYGRGDVAALATDLDWALSELERHGVPPPIAPRVNAVRDRLASVLSDNTPHVLCSTFAALIADAQWVLDEIERPRKAAEATPATPRRPRKLIPVVTLMP